MKTHFACMWAALALVVITTSASAQLAVKADVIHTMAGGTINDGVVLIENGKILDVGPASMTRIPDAFEVIEAAVVTPGLVDAHATVGLTGQYNQDHDQDQLERSEPIQPELRAIDAYNTQERLVGWLRGFGVTTVHTGHAPGELISGQTMIAKTYGNSIDDVVIRETAALAATLGQEALKSGAGKSPGTRSKMVSMLRERLVAAQEYQRKLATAEEEKTPARDLELEALVEVLEGKTPLLVTAHRAQDIMNTLRLAEEFDIRIMLDGAAEAYTLIDEIKAAGVPSSCTRR